MTDDLPRFEEGDRIRVEGKLYEVEVVDKFFEADKPDRILNYRIDPVEDDGIQLKLFPKLYPKADAFVLSRVNYMEESRRIRIDVEEGDRFVFRGDEYDVVDEQTLASGTTQYKVEPVGADTPPANLVEEDDEKTRLRVTRFFRVEPEDVRKSNRVRIDGDMYEAIQTYEDREGEEVEVVAKSDDKPDGVLKVYDHDGDDPRYIFVERYDDVPMGDVFVGGKPSEGDRFSWEGGRYEVTIAREVDDRRHGYGIKPRDGAPALNVDDNGDGTFDIRRYVDLYEGEVERVD